MKVKVIVEELEDKERVYPCLMKCVTSHSQNNSYIVLAIAPKTGVVLKREGNSSCVGDLYKNLAFDSPTVWQPFTGEVTLVGE